MFVYSCMCVCYFKHKRYAITVLSTINKQNILYTHGQPVNILNLVTKQRLPTQQQ